MPSLWKEASLLGDDFSTPVIAFRVEIGETLRTNVIFKFNYIAFYI